MLVQKLSYILVSPSVTLLVLAVGCATAPTDTQNNGDPSGNPVPASFNVVVDSTLAPGNTVLPAFEDGQPRPIATLTDKSGKQTDFVSNELMVEFATQDELNAFLTRWNGTVLSKVDYAAYGLTGNPVYLIRVQTSLADASTLAANLAALNPNGGSTVRVNNEDGAMLIAAGAEAAAQGKNVGINFVMRSTGFQDRLLKEGTVASGAITTDNGAVIDAYDPNPFNWSYMKVGGGQNIGVAEAWRALDRVGAFNNKVKIAIIDGGFGPGDADYPASWEYNKASLAALDPTGPNDVECSGGSSCPWHGWNVVETCMGQVNNGFGAAGPAAPVGSLLAIRRSGDVFNNIQAIAIALFSGANIINMSFSARVPATLSWSVVPFDLATLRAEGAGKLLFASAGNDGEDINEEDCFVACWEEAWWTPCENGGVICVGAMDAGGPYRRSDSNYGGDELDIWGPGRMWVAGDFGNPNIHVFGATSGASPFVAGVAALIWAANPGLNNGDVERILYETANRGTLSGQVERWPNAYAAVIRALGNTPPELSNVKVERVGFTGKDIQFSCVATDAEDGTPQITWTSDRVGVIGNSTFFGRSDLPYGTHVFTCTIRDSAGMQLSQSIVFDIVNSPPTVVIDSPPSGASYFAGQTAFFKVYTYDLESSAALPDNRVVWTSNRQGNLGTGNFLQKELSTVGNHTVTVNGTDVDGVSRSATVNITVLPTPPDGVPPTAFIYGFDYNPNTENPELDLNGVGQDKEDGPLTGTKLAWTLQSATVTWNIPGGVAFGNSPKALLSGTGNFRITLTVTDSTGKTGTDFKDGVISPLR